MGKYNFHSYLHFNAVTVSHPKNRESACHVYFQWCHFNFKIQSPSYIEKGAIRRPSFQLTKIKTTPYTPTDVDSVCIHIQTQVNSNGGSAIPISDLLSSKN